jgi:hypothetical protein
MIDLYLLISIFIGIIVAIDGYLLVRSNGNFNASKILTITSSIEFIWVIFSILSLSKLSFTIYQLLIPVLYITHNALGWLYGIILLNKPKNTQTNDVIVPMWHAKFGRNFGIFFTIICTYAFLQLLFS